MHINPDLVVLYKKSISNCSYSCVSVVSFTVLNLRLFSLYNSFMLFPISLLPGPDYVDLPPHLDTPSIVFEQNYPNNKSYPIVTVLSIEAIGSLSFPFDSLDIGFSFQ